MASLIPPELMAQLLQRQNVPQTVNTGMGQVLPPAAPLGGPGLFQRAQATRMQGQMTPPGGPGGMSPLAESVTRSKLLEAYGIESAEDQDKYKDVPIHQLHPILQAVSAQRNQQRQLELHQQALEHQVQREAEQQQHYRETTARQEQHYKETTARQKETAARQEQHQNYGEAKDALAERMRQVKELEGEIKGMSPQDENWAKSNNDLMAAKQEVMRLTRMRDQYLPQQASAAAPPAAAPQPARPQPQQPAKSTAQADEEAVRAMQSRMPQQPQQPQGQFQLGQTITNAQGESAMVVGFDKDGHPLIQRAGR